MSSRLLLCNSFPVCKNVTDVFVKKDAVILTIQAQHSLRNHSVNIFDTGLWKPCAFIYKMLSATQH